MDIIIKGIGSGIFLALLIGPVFFTLIQTSLEKGFVSGAFVALGVMVSDICCIAVAWFGLSGVIVDPGLRIYMIYGGGLILLSFGSYYLFVKSRRLLFYNAADIKQTKPLRLMAKGFIINGLNPMALIFWLGTVGFATAEWGFETPSRAGIFFGSLLVTVLGTDLLKVSLSARLRMVMTPKLIRVLNVVLGLVLVFFGGRLIFFGDQIIP
jgi:threonine/homoserine/homoserine lactone efflux protein